VDHLSESEFTVMLLALAVLIGAARLMGELAQRFHQPAILGELIAGVLLGPTVFGAVAPMWQQWIFPSRGANAIVLDNIGSLAIVLFLLVAGLEVDLSIVWKQGRAALKVGVLGTIIPFALGLAGAWFVPDMLGRQVGADPLIFALFLATAMSISALPVIAKTLMDLNLYRTDLGMVVVSAAIFNDLIGWTIFAIILGMIGAHGSTWGVLGTIALTVAYAVVMITAGRWLIHRTLPFLQAYAHWPGGVLGFVVTLGLLGAAFTSYIGIHAIFGAFIVGVAFGASSHLQERTRVLLEEFVSFIFAPVFFASIGLRVDFLARFDLALVVSVCTLALTGKIIGGYLGARWGGMPTRDRWAVSFAMNARGAMEIILGLLALEAGIIRQRLFVALVIMAILTSALSGPLIKLVLRRQPSSRRLVDILSPRTFLRDIRATSRRDAIVELAYCAAGAAPLVDPQTIVDLAWHREQVSATGLGHGVAVPHARVPGLKAPLVAIGVCEAGIDFDAPDGQPAHIVFLIVTPAEDPTIQLDLSASVARLFRDGRALERLLRAANFTEFLAAAKMLEPKAPAV
jgi:Kef-type K+ transport system membrane component KefB/mannitol/fructose-specific phosphotransferase system IIA component (Ntr-type)